MTNKRSRITNKKSKGSFLALPHELLLSNAYSSLSNKAVKCLIDISAQYKGLNNGDLSCTPKLMKECGWNSNSQLEAAKNELLKKGFIALTRQGGRNKCNLYAITWQPIDECKGKLDRPETTTALGYWKKGFNPELADKKLKPVTRIASQCNPNSGLVTENNNYTASH